MSLRLKNQHIKIPGDDAVQVLRQIELVLVSLHKIAARYAVPTGEEFDRVNYERETTRFIDEWNVTHGLAAARAILTQAFDLTLGPDDMDDIERAMEDVPYWSGPGSVPPQS